MDTALIIFMLVITAFAAFVKWTDYRKRKKDGSPS